MLPILLLLSGALALMGVLHELPPTSNVGLFPGTSLMTPDIMEAFLLYLPTSPAVESTKAVIDDIIDGATAAVEDIVDTIRNSAVLAPPGLIWLSDTSRSDIGYYGSDYFYSLDFVFFDVLDGVDVTSGPGDLLEMDLPIFTLEEVSEAIGGASEAALNVTLVQDIGIDDVDDVNDTPACGLFFVSSIVSIYCLWGIIPFLCKLAYKLPLVNRLVDEVHSELKNIPWLLFQLAYVGAGTYILEEAVLGVFFSDPLAHIGWLMERGWIDGTFMAQDFAMLYLWVWWKAVLPAERARARFDMRIEGVEAVGIEERVMRDRDKDDSSMVGWVLGMLDEEDEARRLLHHETTHPDHLD